MPFQKKDRRIAPFFIPATGKAGFYGPGRQIL
jgi:hypothetical protein